MRSYALYHLAAPENRSRGRWSLVFAFALLSLVPLLAACGAPAPAPSAPPPARPLAPAGFSAPTPFPPMHYPGDVSAPDALTGTQPTGGSAPQSVPLKAGEAGPVQQELLQVELDTQKVRGLAPKSDVVEHFVSKDEMQAQLLDDINRTYTNEGERNQELELWLLRFISQPGIGLRQLQAGLLSEQIIGLYEPDKKELFVLSGKSQLNAQARETLAHEYTHSLQDQNYGLRQLLPVHGGDGDRTLAARSLVEGDAVLTSLLYDDQFLSASDFKNLTGTGAEQPSASALQTVPDLFREQLLFPYTRGLQFVRTLYTRGGFQAVNAALADPPHSTEQILHPEKYLKSPRDEPLPVGLPPLTDTLGAGWVYRDTGTLGEFELGLMLRVNGIGRGDDDVTGWGGAQYDLYQRGADSLVMLVTRWDTPDDARRFDLALRQSLAWNSNSGSLWTDGTRYFATRLVGDRVILVAGTDSAAVSRAPLVIR